MFSLKKKDIPQGEPMSATAATASSIAPTQQMPAMAPRVGNIPAMPHPNNATAQPAATVPTAPMTSTSAALAPNIPQASAVQPATELAPTVISPMEAQRATQPDVNRFAPPPDFQKKTPEKAVEKETPKAEVKKESFTPHAETLPNGDKVFKARSVADVNFADCWYTPEKILYIRDKSTKFALIPFETDDMEEFYRALEQGYTGASSYALKYCGESYRVERVITTTGPQYNCRKMPTSTPSLYKLGIPEQITRYLATLAPESGLILFGGPTGMGKTTTASALMKEFLENHGGFLYTIEDPPEMPLDGLYHSKNGALGLCKQCPVENEHWEEGLKSALRSKPRYILVGEIRSPEVASQTLRAATSGHLVLSTIHATSVEDALNSMIKYAMGAGLDQQLVTDLLARGVLAVIHQKLEGTTVLHPVIQTVFANPNPLAPDQLRNAIREGRISLGTLMEAQSTRMFKGMPMFKEM